jgi:hypothetical protein
MSDYQKEHHIAKAPGLLEYLGYVLFLGNLLAGPFVEFKHYRQWINGEGVGCRASAAAAWKARRRCAARRAMAAARMAPHMHGPAHLGGCCS